MQNQERELESAGQSLRIFGELYKTDKVDWGYLPIYDKLFLNRKQQKLKLLEIGVAGGASLRMWRSYFKNAVIVGLDSAERTKNIQIEGVDIVLGDQANHSVLQGLVNKYGTFDIVIDDGGHFPQEQIKSFEFLFPFMSRQGLYCIEDLHNSYWPEFNNGLYHSKTSIMQYLKTLSDAVQFHPQDSIPTKAPLSEAVLKEVYERFFATIPSGVRPFMESIASIAFYKGLSVIERG